MTDSKASMTSGPRLSVTGGFKWDNSFSMPSASDMKEDLNSDSEDSDDESGQAKVGEALRTCLQVLPLQRQV